MDNHNIISREEFLNLYIFSEQDGRQSHYVWEQQTVYSIADDATMNDNLPRVKVHSRTYGDV